MEEMFEKKITLLVPKSALEEFEKIIEGFSQFRVNQYYEESFSDSAFKSKSLTLKITSTKII